MNRGDQIKAILLIALSEFHRPASKAQVLEHVISKAYFRPTTHDLEMVKNGREERWRISFAFEYKHLSEDGLVAEQAIKKDEWCLTEKGRQSLAHYCDQASESAHLLGSV